MSKFMEHEIEIFIDGKPRYLVDVPTHQGPEAAERRAVVAIMSQHRDISMERITAKHTGKSKELA